MSRAQGALEYLVIIAAALAITAVVTSLVITYFAPQQTQYNYVTCRQAASTCKTTMSTNPNDACAVCNSACNYSNGTEIFPGAIKCCRFGDSASIYEGSSGCAGCFADTDCTSTPLTPHCYNSTHTCVECAKNSDCIGNPNGNICSASTHTCISACRLDSECTGTNQQCCSHQCKTIYTTAADCLASVDARCAQSSPYGHDPIVNNPGTCDSSCTIYFLATGANCNNQWITPSYCCDDMTECNDYHKISCTADHKCSDYSNTQLFTDQEACDNLLDGVGNPIVRECCNGECTRKAECGPYCGDTLCTVGTETCTSCPQDCGACVTNCDNDGVCDTGETFATCPADCHCGDGACNYGETFATCPADCHCGDGACNYGETFATCPADCHCGDGACNYGETVSSCPYDCPVLNLVALSHSQTLVSGKAIIYDIDASQLASADMFLDGSNDGSTIKVAETNTNGVSEVIVLNNSGLHNEQSIFIFGKVGTELLPKKTILLASIQAVDFAVMNWDNDVYPDLVLLKSGNVVWVFSNINGITSSSTLSASSTHTSFTLQKMSGATDYTLIKAVYLDGIQKLVALTADGYGRSYVSSFMYHIGDGGTTCGVAIYNAGSITPSKKFRFSLTGGSMHCVDIDFANWMGDTTKEIVVLARKAGTFYETYNEMYICNLADITADSTKSLTANFNDAACTYMDIGSRSLWNLAVGDMNGNGKDELLVGETVTWYIYVFENTPNTPIGTKIDASQSTNPYLIKTIDFPMNDIIDYYSIDWTYMKIPKIA